MPHTKKQSLLVKRDKVNQWFCHESRDYRVQLCGDPRLGGYWIKQYAEILGKHNFMKDLTEILSAMEKDKKAAFTLYEIDNNYKKGSSSDTQLTPEKAR